MPSVPPKALPQPPESRDPTSSQPGDLSLRMRTSQEGRTLSCPSHIPCDLSIRLGAQLFSVRWGKERLRAWGDVKDRRRQCSQEKRKMQTGGGPGEAALGLKGRKA